MASGAALNSAARDSRPSPWGFPWDLGVAGFIFGNGEMPGARTSLTTWTGPVPPDPGPRPPQDPQREQEVRVLPGGGAASADWNPKIAGTQRLASSWPEQQAEERDSAVQIWKTIVERTGPTSSKLASQLHECQDPDSALIIVQNTFRRKASATLMKRGCSVTAYLRWSDLEGVDLTPSRSRRPSSTATLSSCDPTEPPLRRPVPSSRQSSSPTCSSAWKGRPST